MSRTPSSLEDCRQLASKLAAGDLGPAAKAAFTSYSTAFDTFHTPASATKMAVADDNVHESDDDARKRRLAELLNRREHSGLATGSATPTPPRDNA